MKEQVALFVHGLQTNVLIDLYNQVAQRLNLKTVVKFRDRLTAEDRLNRIILNWEPTTNTNFFEEFPKAKEKAIAGGFIKATPKEKEALAKITKTTAAHLNLRCAHCHYYAKTTIQMLKIARLICPVDNKHGLLLTKEERKDDTE